MSYKECKASWCNRDDNWRKATQREKDGLKVLCGENKQRSGEEQWQFSSPRKRTPGKSDSLGILSLLARGITNYPTKNDYVETKLPEGGCPRLPKVCGALICDSGADPNGQKGGLVVACPWISATLAHQLLRHRVLPHAQEHQQPINYYAIESFHVPKSIGSLVSNCSKDLLMGTTLQVLTMGWQRLEVGITMGCSVSPILCAVAHEVILIGARQMAPAREPTYMDDITCLLPTVYVYLRQVKRMYIS